MQCFIYEVRLICEQRGEMKHGQEKKEMDLYFGFIGDTKLQSKHKKLDLFMSKREIKKVDTKYMNSLC